MKAATLAALLALPARAAAAPLDAVVSAFGEEGLATLVERGDAVVQGRGAERRLAAVHWKALEALAATAPSCRALSRAFAAAGDAAAPAGPDLGIAACRRLPDDGAMTPRLHALAAAVSAEREESWALAASSAPLAQPPGRPNLFETSWGKDLAARRRADRLEDPAGIVKSFFEELLAGPRPNADAAKDFVAAATARGAAGADALLARDVSRGALSDELRAELRRYLQDERRRRGRALALARLKELAADKAVRRELAALDALATALSTAPSALAGLEAQVSSAGTAAPAPRLRSAGLHLQDPVRLGQYELGDEAVVSGAYWVDGLPEGASVEVEETTFVETPRGFASVETRAVKRKDGGPYPFERRLTIAETSPFAVRAVVSAAAPEGRAAAGAAVAERVEVAVAPDFELALRKEAAALQESQSCRPKAAGDAYAALEALVADAAKVKPQYKALLERARKGRARAADDAKALAALEEAVAAARVDSSPEQCRYETARTDAAIKLARKLPAGCDLVLPELFAARALVSRRAEDQRWFLKASAEARSRRRSCDFAAAAERWTQALAVLDADPAARCGAAADEAARAEGELAAARRSLAWSEALSPALAKAEAETVPARRLELARPLIARLASLDDAACRSADLKRAERLAAAAGEAEGGPAPAEALRRLPPETGLAAAIADVRRARARLVGEVDAASAPDAAPAPAAPEGRAAAPEGRAPAGPAAGKAAAKRARKAAPKPKAEDSAP